METLYDKLPRTIQLVRNMSLQHNCYYKLVIVNSKIDWLGPYFRIERLQENKDNTEELLKEWFFYWRTNDDMPAKMPDALHVRTAIYLKIGRL